MSASAQHIVILFHDFSFGGTEVVALRLAGEWQRQGRRVTILCGTLDGPLIGSVPAGVQIRTLAPEIGRSVCSRLKLRRLLAPAIARLRPDIVFLPGNFHLVLARAGRSRLGSPAIVGKISNPLAPGRILPLRWLLERLYRWAARDVDALVAMSSGLAADVARLTEGHETHVIHDPNILSDAPASCPAKAAGDGLLRLVAAGRLVTQKDFALAIRVTAELARSRKVHLTILGEGPERARLQRLARQLGIGDAVSLPGHAPSIAPALDAADLLLVTSRYEGGPAVAVEALHRGVPVIATDCSHFLRDLIRCPDHGAIIASRRPEPFAAQLLAWLEHPGRCGFCGPSATASLDSAYAAGKYLRLFDGLLSHPRSRPERAAIVAGNATA